MLQLKSLLFGTPGIPISAFPHDTLSGIRQVKKLGLDAMEIEFVRNINISEEKAIEVKALAKKLNIVLTCHGQYYINLASKNPKIIAASIERMINAATRIWQCGGWSITWHMAYYLGRAKEKVYSIVKANLKKVLLALDEQGIKIWIRPETGGKLTQWGSLDEICKISSELENVLPCIDFAHLHARSNGRYNSFEEFSQIFETIENYLGAKALRNMHIQVSGIAYAKYGERNHLNLKDSDFNYIDLLKAFKVFKIKGVVITESPNVESDALLLKREWKKLKQN